MNIKIDWFKETEIRRLFSWQTRSGIAPKFGTRPIGWYQQHQCAAQKFLLDRAAEFGSFDATCRKGVIYLGKNRVGEAGWVFGEVDKSLRV